MIRFAFTLLFFIFITSISAQNLQRIKGKVLDSIGKQNLPGATILLTNTKDSLNSKGTVTNESGDFILKAKPGNYKLVVSFIGYKSTNKTIVVASKNLDLGQIILQENHKILNEITIVETLPPSKQRGDTTVFDPKAYKVNPDAMAQDLLAKMPGFYSVNGKLMAQGHEVKEVLVDGKKFFGNNTNQALETIPHDVIKNIEVYEYESDEAKFSGVKDKEKKKSLNIVTNKKKKNMVFGNVAGGIGKDEKYALKGTLNHFSDKNRITLSGKSKNVSAPLNLSNKNVLRSPLTGNKIQQDNFAFNFNTTGENKNELAATYYFGNSARNGKSNSIRTYTSSALENQILTTDNQSDNKRKSHNLNLYWQIQSNPKNYFILNTSASASDSKSNRSSFSKTTKKNQFLNSNQNLTESNGVGKNINQSILFMRKLNEKGRSLSVQGSFSYNENNSDGSQLSKVRNESNEINQSINQISDKRNTDENISAGISFNENFGENAFFTINYEFALNTQKSKKENFNYDDSNQTYSTLDILTSNRFKNTTEENTGRLSYNLQKENFSFVLGTDIQHSRLTNKTSFPTIQNVDKDYLTVLPSVHYSYNVTTDRRLSVYYQMGATNPQAEQLQEVVNTSNPLFISTGNPNLKQSSSHMLMASYTASNMENGRFTFISLTSNMTDKLVGQRTIVAQKDTTINKKYFLPQGGQFSQPVNLDGQYNLDARVTVGLPVKKLSSKLNLTSAANYSHTPTIVNSRKSFTNSLSLNQTVQLSSNINEKLDFTILSQSQYSSSTNSRNTSFKSQYYSQISSMNLYWNFAGNFILKTNISNSYKNNYTTKKTDYNWLVDLGISTKVFKSKRGEISLVAYDILNNASERSHSVSDLYTVDIYSEKLNKFYMLSFTYKIRNGKNSRQNNGSRMQNQYYIN